MPPVEITDFASYDLGRLLHALRRQSHDLGPTAYGVPALWGLVQEYLPWDQRAGRCWDDGSFKARYTWLRARLVAEGAGHDYPIDKICTALAELLTERMALDPEDEPF